MDTQDNSQLLALIAKHGILTPTETATANYYCQQFNLQAIDYLISEQKVSSDQILQQCATTYELPIESLDNYPFEKLPEQFDRRHIDYQKPLITLENNKKKLTLAVSSPDQFAEIEKIKFRLSKTVELVLVDHTALIQLICRLLSTHQQQTIINHNASVPDYINQLLIDAIIQNASDIHFEVQKRGLRIRFRIDGIMREISHLPIKLSPVFFNRIKVMARLDITENRLPQDGRFSFTTPFGAKRDCRTATIATFIAEKCVIRLLEPKHQLIDIENLGMNAIQFNIFKKKINRPQGCIITTGPTGSGKSSTLYSILNHLNTTEKNIITVEDPVEIIIDGITQISINPDLGLTFANVLRAMLRQDPDSIMLGEIRDEESASIAIRAALTGHLILASLHTNTAAQAIARLIQMKVGPYSIINAIKMIVGQRLVRKRCPYCAALSVYGCHQCYQGYRHRTAIFEVLEITEAVAEVILDGGSALEIEQIAISQGMTTLSVAAACKVSDGITDYAEVNRILEP